jgi:hypothetical protein
VASAGPKVCECVLLMPAAQAANRVALAPVGKADQAGSRTTLVLAFWAAGRQPAKGHPGGGPARHPPWREPVQLQQQPERRLAPQHVGPMQAQEQAWPAALAWHGDLGAAIHQASLQLSTLSPQCLAPAWVQVPERSSATDSVSPEADVGVDQQHRRSGCNGVLLPLPPLRFFLASEVEFWVVYGE